MAGWRGGESRGLGGPGRGCPVSHGPTLPFCILPGTLTDIIKICIHSFNTHSWSACSK